MIPCRGLTKESKWVYGCYLFDNSYGDNRSVHLIFPFEKIAGLSTMLYTPAEGIKRFSGECYQVIPETVGQLTSLKDKNGKEDWIDDIVETKVGGFTYRRRIFQAESGAFCINLPVIGATGGEDAIMLITCEHENIGNVHSNPELLGEKK